MFTAIFFLLKQAGGSFSEHFFKEVLDEENPEKFPGYANKKRPTVETVSRSCLCEIKKSPLNKATYTANDKVSYIPPEARVQNV